MPTKTVLILLAAFALTACEGRTSGELDRTVDRGIDTKHLSELKAGIWIDPNGCDHWIIDDGIEGYLSQRLDRNGKPVCSGDVFGNKVIGDFKRGSAIFDPI